MAGDCMSADHVAEAVDMLAADLANGLLIQCAYCGSLWSGHRCHMGGKP